MTVSTRSMSPADRLIVALDIEPELEARALMYQLHTQVGVRWFKLDVSSLLHAEGFRTAASAVRDGRCLMLDLKLFGTFDTVKRTMEIVAKLGAAMVTVHADCVEHAVGFGPLVLAVNRLTDGTGDGTSPSTPSGFSMEHEELADGFICSVARAYGLRAHTKKLLVCPGIRSRMAAPNNHKSPGTPRDAMDAGADYIVVGRPIYAVADPVEAARSITAEIKSALPDGI